MKAKQTQAALAVNALTGATPTSLKDAGYKLAVTGETVSTIAQYVMEKAPVILEDLSVNSHKELRADLAEGYKLRAHELWGDNYYVVSKDTGAWLFIGNSVKTQGIQSKLDEYEGREIKQINVHYATSISTVDYGRMGKEDTEQRKVVQKIREDFTGYESDRNKALIDEIKKQIAKAKGETRTRTEVSFVDAVLKQLEVWDKSVQVKATRGDKTADPVRYRMAKDAFLKTYNTK